MKKILCILLVSGLFCGTSKAQKIERKAFKDAKVIRLYVGDSSKDEALVRFAKFINNTGFTAHIPGKEDEPEPEKTSKKQSPASINTKLVLDDRTSGSRQIGDTIHTSMATLYDLMWGDFGGRLKFYSAKDKENNIYVAVTGFAYNAVFGGNFDNMQMQKGGKTANWAQKTLFKQIDKYVSAYPNVQRILYADK
ncbi:hypothetical protein KEM09_19550 [Carboxylicivirga mesophila]|uniref:Uncharacterized protein n=1 Tax=Carboxylicivirga mesophila TaxID=1166478 RepID=A0ABS5KEX6_9BACT|nr:hypothetical protein [Carboxylicivirga mesophila]MBS2213613.1 hypothetical protein [Carboxylicivirga mesophila]